MAAGDLTGSGAVRKRGRPRKPDPIADRDEVLGFLSSMMRGYVGKTVVGEKERMKAAELLGRSYLLFSEKKSESGGEAEGLCFMGEEQLTDG